VIDFRYHLVSIIAVFLALAVGLAVGSTALSGKAVEALTAAQRSALANNKALGKERQELEQQVTADQAFAQASAPRLLAGLLSGERVVVIAAPGADSAVTTGVTSALRQAGAAVTGQVSLTTAFTTTSGQNEADLTQLAQSLASKASLALTAQAGSEVSGQQAVAQLLAASLLSGATASSSTASQAILTGLSQNGFISVDSGTPFSDPADLAILVTPGGPAPQTATSQVLVAVAKELRSAGSGTVMAGATSSIGAGSVISAENSAGNAVSTVDCADTEVGQIMVVQALRYLLNGKPPTAYGIGPALAPSPAPTPVPSQQPKTGVTAAATAKGRA
jgi:Copper transport outer membrane protein, MctB